MTFTRSPSMKEVLKQIERVARFDVPVLLLGESGVGKEVVARQLHQQSQRTGRTFLKVNCAALPSELLESELFGYEAGAFTGATRSKPGQFELCDRGTILLDEIGEMPPSLQAKLLHVVQDQQFSRLGGRRMFQVDVRILAATNVNIDAALATKRFRPDLYYRLNTFSLTIPPLRERREDIPMFLEHFLEHMSTEFGRLAKPFSQWIIDACLSYSWPGNVRELKNFVCRYLLLEDDEALIAAVHKMTAEHKIEEECDEHRSLVSRGLKSLVREIRTETEKRAIEETLARTHWNRTEAARLLRISHKSLYSKIKQYGISCVSRESSSQADDAPRFGRTCCHPFDDDAAEYGNQLVAVRH